MKQIRVRKIITFSLLAVIFSAISLLFWYNEWVYSLPTPVPSDYHNVKKGDYIAIDGRIKAEKK
jgi:hypothetical protein